MLVQYRQKLFTQEDAWNLHKILGLACLVSYMVRIMYMSMMLLFPDGGEEESSSTSSSSSSGYDDDDMGFRSFPELTPWTVALHASLHVTSFQFQIPKHRIKQGTRIWPEFRWHSFCFVLRNLLLISLFWTEQTILELQQPLYWASTAIVFANMICADLISSVMQRKDRRSASASGTIRDLDVPRYVKYLFSSQQFLATSTFLFGPRCYSIQFMNALIIQVTPFMMTLYRKNLVSHGTVVFVYGFLLVTAFLVGAIPFLQQESLVSIAVMAEVGKWAFLWRTNPWMPQRLRNKYLIWGTLSVMIHIYLRTWTLQTELYPWQIHLMITSTTLVAINGYAKCTAKSYASS